MSQNWTAEIRSEEGKGASRRLRRAGKVPAIIYGADKDAVSVAFAQNFVKHEFENRDVFNTVLTIDVNGGETETCVVKDVQRHPATGDVSHIDLQRASDNNQITKTVPFNFVGKASAPGVKMGGMMTILQPTVEIRCLAKNLPTAITVDVSTMEAGASLRLSELALPEGVVITALTHGNTDYDQSVVNITKPKRK
ncbi:50S ribosomal protein L25/general stress protein Ctc [Thiomicrorhabdus sp. ZW0627]|uniref:50S ribosomal protein L25/general stress protein Ctc n=1 Tax=Thiomicrorhabdus sp. ZW0627 TaxID=3039774 RepID=UPI0024368F74|nr:50S ribosomal protein L25/general stress protein Ctc [Thiomicrorhabdus sp. ZW0627]MDG6774784.1 50S ribosomal protein L25/general stress protein Ctc [Thiomicrorhabdus sp. ZW0627]